MAEIHNIHDYKPHIEGKAKCLSCDHEWVFCAPVGTVELECPECKTLKGVSVGCASPEIVLACDYCDNQHFYIQPDLIAICARCGNNIYMSDM